MKPYLLVSLLALTAAAFQPARAAAGDIDKCQTLSKPGSYRLIKNLQATTHCLVVAANDVTIDFDGFSITGDGKSDGVTDTGSAAGPRNGITVRNGSILKARFAISLGSTDSALVERMDVSANLGGIYVNRGRVAGNQVHDNLGSGIEAFEAVEAVDNIILNNAGNGLVSGPGSRIVGNLIGRNGAGILAAGNASATVFESHALFRGNVSFENKGLALGVHCPAILKNNVASGQTEVKGACATGINLLQP